MPLAWKFLKVRDGNVAIMTGLLFGVVAMAAGGATDVSSAHNYRSDLQAVADRAALYGARNEGRTTEQVVAYVEEVLEAKYTKNTYSIDVTQTKAGIEVTIDGNSPNKFLGLFGMDSIDVNVESRAASVAGLADNIEVALVLDTTESMADDMDSLRLAALNLVDTLYKAGNNDDEKVKISVIPYAGTVNIGQDAPMAWMDANAQSQWHAEAIEHVEIKGCVAPANNASSTSSTSSKPSCNLACGCPGKLACGGGNDGASLKLLDGLRYASAPVLERLSALITPTPAYAASHSYTPPAATDCPAHTPNEINNFALFDAIPNAEWMGCVEARPEPFDVTDTAPSYSDPNTLFVPFLWYDDSDRYDSAMPWLNNYLEDTTDLEAEAPAVRRDWDNSRRSSVYKYDGQTPASIDESGSNIIGPNRGCPAPVLPLTSVREDIEGKISDLTHRNGGGTAIPEGLAWGWRTLSPGAPFSEGKPYDEAGTKKIIVLLTDGANAVQKRGEYADGSPRDQDVLGDMTAYGYAVSFGTGDRGRSYIDPQSDPGTPYFDQIRNYLDERTRLVCENIKGASEDNPVEIFVVLVGDHDSRTKGLLSSCATSKVRHYHNASQMTQLSEAFSEIAGEIIGSGRARLTY